jgi:hypothetical protein
MILIIVLNTTELIYIYIYIYIYNFNICLERLKKILKNETANLETENRIQGAQ